jgi:poly-gamma-glutamate synthesis protein (capsule biosynthesis protein)
MQLFLSRPAKADRAVARKLHGRKLEMRILLVGDVMLGRLVNQQLRNEKPEYPWGDTLPLFRSCDVRVCNLECVLSDRGRPWSATPKMFHFRSDAKNVAVLKAASIDAVSNANNHVLDYEYDAMFEMLALLDQAHIAHAGAGPNRAEAWRPAIIQSGAVRVGMIACTDNEPAWEATCNHPGICYTPIDTNDPRTQELIALIADISGSLDFLVVSAHWGGNWGYRPPEEHVLWGRALIDAGADVVFGHSAHVFRGIEIYRRKPILYSTGDFIDDYAVDEIERNDESFVFVVAASGREVHEICLYPTRICSFRAQRAEPGAALVIASKMQALCRELHTDAQWSRAENCLKIDVRRAVRDVA